MKSYSLSINMAMTIDGKVARPDGKWYGLTSINDKIQMDTIRSNSDALIVGKNSIINDNPRIQIKYVNGQSPRPVILLRNGSIPKDRKIFTEKGSINPIIFCLENNIYQVTNELSDVSEIILLKSETLDPKIIIQKLVSLGYSNILLEGGPKLNYSFIKENLINKINLTIVPYIIGKKSLPSFVDGDSELYQFDLNQWKITSLEKRENEIFIVYEKNI